jgi:hypothetical protein
MKTSITGLFFTLVILMAVLLRGHVAWELLR